MSFNYLLQVAFLDLCSQREFLVSVQEQSWAFNPESFPLAKVNNQHDYFVYFILLFSSFQFFLFSIISKICGIFLLHLLVSKLHLMNLQFSGPQTVARTPFKGLMRLDLFFIISLKQYLLFLLSFFHNHTDELCKRQMIYNITTD